MTIQCSECGGMNTVPVKSVTKTAKVHCQFCDFLIRLIDVIEEKMEEEIEQHGR